MYRLSLALSLAAFGGLALGADEATKPVGFREDVAPILVRSAWACHNEEGRGGPEHGHLRPPEEGGQEGRGPDPRARDPDASPLIELVRPGGCPGCRTSSRR